MFRNRLSDIVVTVAAAVTLSGLATVEGIAAERPIVVEGSAYPTEVVSYADLNLASEAGMRALNSRVRSAASRLCRNPGVLGVAETAAASKCMTLAIRGADRQIFAAKVLGTQYASREAAQLIIR